MGQDGGVLGQRLAAVEAQHRDAALRVDLEKGLGAVSSCGHVGIVNSVSGPVVQKGTPLTTLI
jgi:metal-dependent hydrolase (beta-lactamase superfamily II)